MNIKQRIVPNCILLFSIFIFSFSCRDKCQDLLFPDAGNSKYILPYPPGTSCRLFQSYCSGWGHRNRLAYDFEMAVGQVITCSRSGIIIEIKNAYGDDDHTPGHNNRVLVKHSDHTIAWYAHLKQNSISLAPGDSVAAGDTLGLCGTSGRSGKTPHLHFEVFNSIAYDYNDAIPISFRNLSGKTDSSGMLITGNIYSALAFP